MSGPFQLPITVLFQHCDPAGIVFFPRYFEMINQTVEAWCAAMGEPFAKIHVSERRAIPTATISADFHAPSRLGEVIIFALAVTGIGRTSAKLSFHAACEGQTRLVARSTIVQIDLGTGRPIPWSAAFRDKMMPYSETVIPPST